ncbi:MAG: general secretion pathway protein GspK, partial [Thermodesulfobacteriota bacterium]
MFANNNRGIALMITLTIITVLIAVTFELNRQMRDSVTEAAATRDNLALSHMIGSGVDVAKALLIRDKDNTEADSIQDEWADPEIVSQYVAQLPFEKGEISLDITDERSRIQLNALVDYPDGKDFNPAQQKLWKRFFALLLQQQEFEADALFSEPLEPDMIINPVKDWLDDGDNEAISGLTGAENDYYQSLDPPYSCRNGPFKHISELLRVKNIKPELFYSMAETGYGIADYITVYGMKPADEDRHQYTFDGKININTAEMPVIAALRPRPAGPVRAVPACAT